MSRLTQDKFDALKKGKLSRGNDSTTQIVYITPHSVKDWHGHKTYPFVDWNGTPAAGQQTVGQAKDILDAALRSDSKVIKSILVRDTTNILINVTDSNGRGLLHYAAHNEDFSLVGFLLKRGLKVNSKDDSNSSPLHVACSDGTLDMVDLLLKNGADPGIRNKHGVCALHYFCTRTFPHQLDDVVFDKTLQKLISGTMDGVNAGTVHADTPLHFHVCSPTADPKICRLLMESAANPLLPNDQDQTVLGFVMGHDTSHLLSQLSSLICESKTFKKRRITPVCKKGPPSPSSTSPNLSSSSSPSSPPTSLGFSSSTSTICEKHDGDEEHVEGWGEDEDQERNRGGSVPDKFPTQSSPSPPPNTPPPSSPHTPLRLKSLPPSEKDDERRRHRTSDLGGSSFPPRPSRSSNTSVTSLSSSESYPDSSSSSSPSRSSSPGPRAFQSSDCSSPRAHAPSPSPFTSLSSLAYKLQTKSRTDSSRGGDSPKMPNLNLKTIEPGEEGGSWGAGTGGETVRYNNSVEDMEQEGVIKRKTTDGVVEIVAIQPRALEREIVEHLNGPLINVSIFTHSYYYEDYREFLRPVFAALRDLLGSVASKLEAGEELSREDLYKSRSLTAVLTDYLLVNSFLFENEKSKDKDKDFFQFFKTQIGTLRKSVTVIGEPKKRSQFEVAVDAGTTVGDFVKVVREKVGQQVLVGVTVVKEDESTSSSLLDGAKKTTKKISEKKKKGEEEEEVLGVEVVEDEDLVQDYWDEGKEFVFSLTTPSSSSPFPSSCSPSCENSKYYSISLFQNGVLPLRQLRYNPATADKATKMIEGLRGDMKKRLNLAFSRAHRLSKKSQRESTKSLKLKKGKGRGGSEGRTTLKSSNDALPAKPTKPTKPTRPGSSSSSTPPTGLPPTSTSPTPSSPGTPKARPHTPTSPSPPPSSSSSSVPPTGLPANGGGIPPSTSAPSSTLSSSSSSSSSGPTSAPAAVHARLASLTQCPVEEIAEAITFLQIQAVKLVGQEELMHKNFMTKETSPLLKKVVDLSNLISKTIMEEVLREEEDEEREEVVDHILRVALALKELNNYEGMFAVMTALTSGPVHRLTSLFSSLPSETKAIFSRLKNYSANNFARYRKELSDIVVSGEPENLLMYSACTLRDLTYIEELKNFKDEEKGLVNWKKMEMLFEIFRAHSIVCESKFGSLRASPAINHYILERPHPSEEQLYALSKEIQPTGGLRAKPKDKKKTQKSSTKSRMQSYRKKFETNYLANTASSLPDRDTHIDKETPDRPQSVRVGEERKEMEELQREKQKNSELGKIILDLEGKLLEQQKEIQKLRQQLSTPPPSPTTTPMTTSAPSNPAVSSLSSSTSSLPSSPTPSRRFSRPPSSSSSFPSSRPPSLPSTPAPSQPPTLVCPLSGLSTLFRHLQTLESTLNSQEVIEKKDQDKMAYCVRSAILELTLIDSTQFPSTKQERQEVKESPRRIKEEKREEEKRREEEKSRDEEGDGEEEDVTSTSLLTTHHGSDSENEEDIECFPFRPSCTTAGMSAQSMRVSEWVRLLGKKENEGEGEEGEEEEEEEEEECE